MLYDLNITWTPQTTRADLERTIRSSQSLGYNVVALNHTFGAPIPANITNPIPQLGPVHSSFPQTLSSSSSNNAPNPTSSSTRNLPTTLRRATVLISDPSTNYRLPALAAAYDILAVRPTTEKAFLSACTTMSEISLISLDLTTPFPFHFRPKPCMAAVNRGILFEICYGQLVSPSSASDPRQRAVFIGNVIEIIRATRGRGIVLSSEARPLTTNPGGGVAGPMVRAPVDVVNLFAAWGLSNEKGHEALGTNPRSVVVNDGLKRRSFRSVVDMTQTGGKISGRGGVSKATATTDDEDNDGEGNNNNNEKNNKQKQTKKKKKGAQNENTKDGKTTKPPNHQKGGVAAASTTNGKRKHEATNDPPGGANDQDNNNNNKITTTANTLPSLSSPPAGAAISKRQAKKMKLAQRATDPPLQP